MVKVLAAIVRLARLAGLHRAGTRDGRHGGGGIGAGQAAPPRR